MVQNFFRTKLSVDDDAAIQDLSKFTGKSGKELQDWIDYAYDCIPTLAKNNNISKVCNVRLA